MAKIKITETNGASAEDISDAIGRFLAQQAEKQKDTEKDNTEERNI